MTKKDMRAIMTQCIFNPKEHGPKKILADVHNRNYYETAAKRSLEEALTRDACFYESRMIEAIQYIMLALGEHNQEQKDLEQEQERIDKIERAVEGRNDE